MEHEHITRALRSIDITADEIHNYRRGLAQRLPERSAFIGFRPGMMVGIGLAICGILAWWSFSVPQSNVFQQLDLAEIGDMVQDPGHVQVLHQQAQAAMQNELEPGRANAAFVYFLLEPELSTSDVVDQLQREPRPEFRAAYLEHLLDRHERPIIHEDELETILEKEIDKTCRKLLQIMLNQWV